MAALTQDRMTPSREGSWFGHPVAAAKIIYAGSMVALDASGNAVPASDTAGLTVIGRAEERADNSSGSAADVTVPVTSGVFGFAASAGNAPTKANIGDQVYVEDDQTVSTDAGTNSVVAGVLVAVDTDYCWVHLLPESARRAANQADSEAADVATLKTDFNALLAKLQAAGLMA